MIKPKSIDQIDYSYHHCHFFIFNFFKRKNKILVLEGWGKFVFNGCVLPCADTIGWAWCFRTLVLTQNEPVLGDWRNLQVNFTTHRGEQGASSAKLTSSLWQVPKWKEPSIGLHGLYSLIPVQLFIVNKNQFNSFLTYLQAVTVSSLSLPFCALKSDSLNSFSTEDVSALCVTLISL